MSRSRKRLLFGLIAGFGVLLLGGISFVVGTESGTRWLIRQATGFLPDGIEIGQSRGALLSGIRIDSIEWRSESARVSIEDLALDIELLPLFARRVAIDELDVERVDIRLPAANEAGTRSGLPALALPVGVSIAASSIRNVSIRSDRIDRTVDDIRLTGRMDGPDLDITRLDVRSAWLGLELAGRATLADRYPADFRSAWRWTHAETVQFAGELQVEGDLHRFDLLHSLTAPVAVSTTGTVAYESGRLTVDLGNEWQSLEWVVAEHRVRSSGGTIRLSGPASNLAVNLDASAQLDDQPEARIELDGDADLQGMRISRLEASNDLGRLAASGDVLWLPELLLALDFAALELDPSVALDASTGAVELDGQVNGRFIEGNPEIDLRIDRIGGDINGYPLQGSAEIAYRDDALAISNARVQHGTNHAGVSGTIGEAMSLNLDLRLSAIGELLPEASGSLGGLLAISGPRSRPDLRVEMDGSELAWRDHSLGTLSADARVSSTARSHVSLALEKITVGERELDSARFSASGQIDAHSIRASVSAYGGELTLDVTGGYRQHDWEGRIESLAVAGNATGRWSTREPSGLTASVDDFSLSRTCLYGPSDPGAACFNVDLRKGEAVSFDVLVNDVPLAAVRAALPTDLEPSGWIDARSHGVLTERRLSGDAEITLRDAALEASHEGETVSVALAHAVGRATIADNRVESTLRLELANGAGSGNLQLEVQDFADVRAEISGRGELSIYDASLFAVLLPDVTDPRGRIDGDLTVSGSLDRPEFAGEVALTDGAFGVRQAGIEVSEVDVRLTQRSAGRLQLSGSARSGDGRVSILGETRIGAAAGIRTEVVVSGENFELARLADWQIAASPSVTIVLDERTASVTGELVIPKANIDIKTLPETAESPSPDATVHRAEGAAPPAGRRIDVDVTTVLGDDVRFSGFGLTTGIAGSVRLAGGTHAPYTGRGTLALRDGRYKAYGQELEIERGELIFNGPLDNPDLDVRAIRRANDVVAGIQLSGTPARLRSDIFSEPAMSDADALSYLLTGRPLASVTGAGESDALNQAAFALGLSGAGSIVTQIRGQLGLETLTVEGGAESGRIVAGKRLSDRLLVEYGYGIIDKLGTLLLRYQLNDRIVLESRTGTVSNLDIVYTVKKK